KFEKQKRKEGKKEVEEDVLVEVGPGVTEFVRYDLERDHITFSNDLYRQIFEEAVAYMEDVHFDSGRYFLSHPNPQVSKLASELMSDRYHLSKIHAKILGEEMDDKSSRLLEKNLLNSYVPRATTELKNFYVLQKIEELKKEMKSGNKDDYVTLITRLKQLQEIKKVLSKELGERIVLKY
ncbi:MAG: DNA primase, partial [Proteiniphilum sp.]